MLKKYIIKYFLKNQFERFSFFFSPKMSQNEPEDALSKCVSESGGCLDKIENGKNKHLVKCQFCPSRILNPGFGVYAQNVFELPMMTKKKNTDTTDEKIQYEKFSDFWQVNDMYTFENISFSNTVDDIKYLACADCEIGPIGYHNMKTKISYIALDRVKHVPK